MIEQGQIVEYIDNNRFVVAVCLDFKKEKPRLLTQANREVVLPLRRLIAANGPRLSLDTPREELVLRLKELNEKRENLKTGIDLAELWSLVDEGDDSIYSPGFLAGLTFGDPANADQVSALLRAVIEDKVYFRYRPEGLSFTPPEKVDQLLAQQERQLELAREREEAGGWLAKIWSGQESEPPDGTEAVIDKLTDVAVNGNESPHWSQVKSYFEAAEIKHPRAAFELLVKMGRFDPDEDLWIRRFNLPTVFPQTAVDEAEALAAAGVEAFDWSDREDLTGLETFTLDGPATTDFDDALSFEPGKERHTLHVHITDITPFIKPGSALDSEAQARAASLYLPEKRLPMLPEILSEGLLSLKEEELRPAFSLRVELDDRGEVLDHRLTKSLIKVNKRLIYQEVNQSLNDEPQLLKLYELAQALQERRVDNGAMILDVPEIIVRTTKGRIEVEQGDQNTPSRMLVAEMMVLANWLVAKSLAEAGVPALFRTQPPIGRLFEAPEGADPLWVTLRQRMLLNRLAIRTSSAPHASLGLDAYTTFTSPIRRFMDLITLRQLHSLIDQRPPTYDSAALDEICVVLAPLLRTHNQIKFRRLRYWLLKYLAQEQDAVREALVLERRADRFSLILLETMLRVSSPKLTETALTPGQRVMVKATKVDPLDDIIRVELV